LVWDEGEETAIQAPNGTGPKITWSGPPLGPKVGKERFHFHVAPASDVSVEGALDDLLASGATRLDRTDPCASAIGLADVDGNEFCLLEP
jgi:Glyoxalase-like domain